MSLAFSKMHGIGNDVLVIDARQRPFALSAQRIAALGDRHRGIGFDQLMLLEPARSEHSLASYRIYNSDGSVAQQCGNGVRCLAAWLQSRGEIDGTRVCLDAPRSLVLLRCENALWSADMGPAAFEPQAMALRAAPALRYAVDMDGEQREFGAASMGNPHALFEQPDLATAIEPIARALQASALFAEGCNVSFASVQDRQRIRLRVYERGAGETLACGSAACAAVAILQRWGRVDERVDVELPGGMLSIRRDPENGHLWMSGPAELVFHGELPDD